MEINIMTSWYKLKRKCVQFAYKMHPWFFSAKLEVNGKRCIMIKWLVHLILDTGAIVGEFALSPQTVLTCLLQPV